MIRQATHKDLAHIESFDEMGGSRAEEISSACCIVATIDDRVVGYASYAPKGLLGQPLLTYLCVEPARRRQGTGGSLVQAIQRQARGRKLISSTEDWCVGTQRIFERLGWQRIGALTSINKDGSTELFFAIDATL